jgi:membrane-associated phospholipid phosphatase
MRGLPAVAILAGSLLTLTVLVGIGFDPLLDLDHVVAWRAYDATFGHEGRIELWQRVTDYGAPTVMRVAILLAALLLALRRRWVLSLWLIALAVLETVVAPAAKLVLERPRPSWVEPIATLASTSYPSGHATAAATAAMAGALLAREVSRSRTAGVLVPVVLAVVAGAVAASRVFLGVHFLSDVVGGLLLGALLALSTYLAAGRLSRAAGRRAESPSRLSDSAGHRPVAR